MSYSRGTRGRLYGKTLGALVVKGNKQSSSPNPQEVDKVRELKSRLFQSSGKMDEAKTTWIPTKIKKSKKKRQLRIFRPKEVQERKARREKNLLPKMECADTIFEIRAWVESGVEKENFVFPFLSLFRFSRQHRSFSFSFCENLVRPAAQRKIEVKEREFEWGRDTRFFFFFFSLGSYSHLLGLDDLIRRLFRFRWLLPTAVDDVLLKHSFNRPH